MAARAIKGGAVGLGVGLILFRTRSMRRSSMFYGAGFGLGMSYSQVNGLKSAFFCEKDPQAELRE